MRNPAESDAAEPSLGFREDPEEGLKLRTCRPSVQPVTLPRPT